MSFTFLSVFELAPREMSLNSYCFLPFPLLKEVSQMLILAMFFLRHKMLSDVFDQRASLGFVRCHLILLFQTFISIAFGFSSAQI